MKKILGLAIAAALTSPMALADNTPSNVGNVTYLGNIVANSPMWQWTVNDYPGGSLDAKPSEAVEANGTYTYPLSGQAFIAVSGYLPAMGYVSNSPVLGGSVGLMDKTSFTDAQGDGPGDITASTNGAVTFTIIASAYGTDGKQVTGRLKLNATELRGNRLAYTELANNTPTKLLYVFGSTQQVTPIPDGSCFVGTGPYTNSDEIIKGTATNPIPGSASITAYTAYFNALSTADATGNTVKFQSLAGGEGEAVSRGSSCATPSGTDLMISTPYYKDGYLAAAHVVELSPVELVFNTPVQGAWNSTLTVTAYTM